MSNKRRITWLKGDYVGNHKRQAQAQSEGCKLVIEFHFNSNGPIATGGETWSKPGDPLSNTIAADIRNRFSNIGLSLHGPGPNEAVSSTRAGWLPFYSCSAILLEPLYVSNPDQARWIHQSGNVDLLAGEVTAAIFNNTSDADTIGLSIGHRFKHSHPNDLGAACALGDNEADHGMALAEAVAAKLTAVAPVAAGEGIVPAPEHPVLTSPLFQGNTVLEAVAEGHLVLQASGGKVDGIGPVQDALNTLGFPINLGSNDQFRGFFGEKTQAALRAFQQATPGILQPTGVVGQDTIKALDAALVTHGVAPEPPETPEDIRLLTKGKVVATLKEKPGGSGSLRSVDIMQLAGRVGFYYKAAMAIDVDGSPRAYTQDATSPKPLDSLESVDSEGIETMYIQQRSKTVRGVTRTGEGPFKDFFVSRTSLKFKEDEAFKTSNFVDAEMIPYIIFPHHQNEPEVFSAVSLGDVAYVIDLKTGRSTHAIMRSYCSLVARERQIEPRDWAPAQPQNRRRPHRRALNSSRAERSNSVRPSTATRIALRARTNLQALRNPATTKSTLRRQNHPRRSLQGWLKTSDSSAVLLYKAKYLLLKLQHGSGRVVSEFSVPKSIKVV